MHTKTSLNLLYSEWSAQANCTVVFKKVIPCGSFISNVYNTNPLDYFCTHYIEHDCFRLT